MVNPSKAKGTKFETDLLGYLRENLDGYVSLERLALSGGEDEGDLAINWGVGCFDIIEAKAEREYRFSAYLAEAEIEAENFARHRGLSTKYIDGIVVAKRRNQPIGKSFVIQTVDGHWGIK